MLQISNICDSMVVANRMKEKAKLIFICLGIVLVLLLLVYTKKILLQKIRANTRTVLLGVWTEGFWNDQTKKLENEKIKVFERNINKKVAIAHYFRGWDELGDPQVVSELQSIDAEGWIPLLSTNPYFTKKCSPTKEDIYTAIAEGKCDDLLHSIAAVLKTFGKPLFLRFAWEMNINSNSWSIQSTYSTPEKFVKAWKHIHILFAADEVKNVQWVFSINVESPDTISVAQLYPGDEYVDWTGLDGYNYGTSQSWSHWSSFSEVFHTSYEHLLAVAPNKPMMLSEFNSASRGGDKSAWLADALNVQIPHNYPKVKAVIFFNENKMTSEGVDWRMENSQSVLDTLKKSLQNPMYK